MHTPFVFGDKAQELRGLVAEAGFHDVSVQTDVSPVRFQSPEEFVRTAVAGTPLANHFVAVDETIQTALISEVDSALQPYVNDEGLEFPIEGHLVVAEK